MAGLLFPQQVAIPLRLASAALQHNILLCLQFTGGNIFLMKKNLVLYLKLN